MDDCIKAIEQSLHEYKIESFVFVDRFKFSSEEEKEMMEQAMRSITECDILIAEISEKAIGVGIETGYAKALGKPIIYLRHKNAEHSTTASGISDFQIVYSDLEDLKERLISILDLLLSKINNKQ